MTELQEKIINGKPVMFKNKSFVSKIYEKDFKKIEIHKYSKSSQQIIFKKYSPEDNKLMEICDTSLWIFDIPGEFCHDDNYSFSDLSFREIGNDLFNIISFEVIGDVSYQNTHLGRKKIVSTSSIFYYLCSSSLDDFLKNRELPQPAKEGLEKISDALTSWINFRRELNRTERGIPYCAHLEISDPVLSKNVTEIGLSENAYFQDQVFSKPYVILKKTLFKDKVKNAYKAFLSKENLALDKTGRVTRYLPRTNITKDKIETGIEGLNSSFNALCEYMKQQPLVSRKKEE